MANKRLRDLNEATHPSPDALMYLVNSPAGTAEDSKAVIGSIMGPDYISGLPITWLSGNSLKVGTGIASLPNGTMIRVTSPITLSGMSFTANAVYHLYLYLSSGAPTVEYSTTVPQVYFGTAQTKLGDLNKRYLRSVMTDGTANMVNFNCQPHLDVYQLSEQYIPSFQATTIVFDEVRADSHNFYDSMTGLYTPAIPGTYEINTFVTLSSLSNYKYMAVFVTKSDTSRVVYLSGTTYSTSTRGGGGSIAVYMDGTSEVSVKVFHDNGIDVPTGAGQSWLQVRYISEEDLCGW